MEQDDEIGSGTPVAVNIGSGQMNGLHKELGGSQEGEDIGADGDGESSTFHDPVEKALTNPVILLNIFSHLEFPVLVNLRLVCKVWDEVVRRSPMFGKMYYIDVQQLFPCCTIAHAPSINPNLAKNIYITDECKNEIELLLEGKEHDTKQRARAAAYNLTTFFNQFHNYVEDIKLNGLYCDSFHTYLVNALNALDFPKLQRIVIVDVFNTGSSFGNLWGWDDYVEDFIATFATFSTRSNLTSLQLDDTTADSPFHDIFQKLIDCAPNLENIEINGNFYPDLSTCKNLEILNYAGIPYYYSEPNHLVEERSFNLESLSTMLDQVKQSLNKLSLKDSYFNCIPSDTDVHSGLEEFKFPDIVKELKVLNIQENSKPFFQPALKKLNPVQVPKLTNLSIRVKTLDNVLEGMSHSFGTISSLHLVGTISPIMRHRIPTIFPNLTSLTMPWSVGSRDEKPDFNAVIDFCSGWKLQKLDIITALQSDWSGFMAGLSRLKQTQNDIKVLKLPSQNNGSREKAKPVFDLWYDTRKEQQQVGTVMVDNILQNLTFGPQSMKKAVEETVLTSVSNFILEHPLVVHFI